MYPYVLLVIIIVFIALQDILRKQLTLKTDAKVQVVTSLFNLCMTGASMCLFFVLWLIRGFTVHWPTIWYAIGFGVTFVVIIQCSVKALQCGPLSLSSLIVSLSLILPAMFGIVALGEPFRVTTSVGLLLLVASLVLVNKQGKEENPQNVRISLRWLIYIAICFLTNGGCAVLSKLHQYQFPGEYQAEFLGIAMIAATVLNFIMVMITNKDGIAKVWKPCLLYGGLTGLLNGSHNFMVLLIVPLLPAAVMYPLISAGGLVLTFFICIFLYKERLSFVQVLGVVIGVVSIVFLNI